MASVEAEMTAIELRRRFDAGDAPLVIDVREEYEREIACIPDTVHIPMGEIVGRLDGLDPKQEIVVMCRSGVRSMQVVRLLQRNGYGSVRNLRGGILAWSAEVDASVPTY